MIQAPLEVYRIDMKYIRNLHNIDDKVLSVSPQIGKDERPFLGVIIIYNEHKYCVPLSKPKKKHEKMRDKIDFKKIIHNGQLIGVLNFNLMIPVEDLLIQKIEELSWFFQYPEDNQNKLKLPNKDEKFRQVLENILKALDPSIREVTISQDVDNAYVIHLQNKSIVIQDDDLLTTDFLSSGTKAGVEVSTMLSSLIQKDYDFYYCDEKFSYIHSDIEKAI